MESEYMLMKFDVLVYVWGPNSVNLIVQFQCSQFTGCKRKESCVYIVHTTMV